MMVVRREKMVVIIDKAGNKGVPTSAAGATAVLLVVEDWRSRSRMIWEAAATWSRTCPKRSGNSSYLPTTYLTLP